MVVDIGYDVWFFLLKSHNACVDVSTFRCPLISSVFVRTVFEAAAATSFLLPCRSLFARARARAHAVYSDSRTSAARSDLSAENACGAERMKRARARAQRQGITLTVHTIRQVDMTADVIMPCKTHLVDSLCRERGDFVMLGLFFSLRALIRSRICKHYRV